MSWWKAGAAAFAIGAFAAGCASTPAVSAGSAVRPGPYPVPDVPPALRASAATVSDRHELAWRRFAGGDVRGAGREFADILKRMPTFYPSETALGFVALAGQRAAEAAARFGGAVARDERYLPAWLGLVDARLALGDEDAAANALERILVLDPSRDAERTRLELLRFRQLQTALAKGREARQAGRLDDARRVLIRALELSPSSAVVLRELAWTALDAGRGLEAEQYARRALAIDGGEAETQALLGHALDAEGRFREASEAYAKAAAADPKWKADADAARDKAMRTDLPAEFRDLPAAAAVTRAQLAALVGLRLRGVLERAPARPPDVATDVRGHWAAPWIQQVTQARVMDLMPNHTFQPETVVQRGDLAQVVQRLATLGLANRPADLARFETARPQFSDLPSSHLAYRAAAFAVAAGAMAVQPPDRFAAGQPASGADVMAAMGRLERLMIR